MNFLGLYVDDDSENRHPPKDDGVTWHRAFNFHDAIHYLTKFNYNIVSLDHDIASFYGNKEMTGYDVLQYLIMRKLEGADHNPTIVRVHSANPVGREKMQKDIDKYFNGL
jgi:hypothetical protein